MNSRSTIFSVVFYLAINLAVPATQGADPKQPNIVVILADDLGYGDVGCYNSEAKVPTPNLDRLAREGMRFTDAHSPATVCTPSRYSLMTGRMCFRTDYRGGVLYRRRGAEFDRARAAHPAGTLREQGYATACVGKWHIGMTFPTKDGTPAHQAKLDATAPGAAREIERIQLVDFTKPIPDGPMQTRVRLFLRDGVLSDDGLAVCVHRKRSCPCAADRATGCDEASQASVRQRLPPRTGCTGLRT